MHRRRMLRTASLALGATLAGCLGGSAIAGGDPSATTTADAGTASRTDDAPTGEATVRVTVENRDERPRSGRVAVVHTETPTCRYATPKCGAPSRRRTPLDAAFDLDAGERRSFARVGLGVDVGDSTVDSYSVRVDSDAGTGELAGLEAGAASTVGREEAGAYPWRVAPRAYRIRATLTPTSVEVALLARS